MTFLNCKSMGNKGVGATSYGFSCTGSSLHSMRFENCSAINNKGDSDAYGFYSESLEYSYFDQCVANNQRTTSVSSVTVAGFYSKGGEGLTFKNCIAFGNKGNANVSDKAIGFCLDAYSGSGEMYSNIIGCQAKDNDGGTGTGYGIYLVSATACTIQKNELFVNHGITGGYGIKDDLTTGNVSAFMENIAYGNGTIDGMVINNYDVKLSPNDDANVFPVRIAFITDYTNLKTIRPLDNIELVEKADVSSL